MKNFYRCIIIIGLLLMSQVLKKSTYVTGNPVSTKQLYIQGKENLDLFRIAARFKSNCMYISRHSNIVLQYRCM